MCGDYNLRREKRYVGVDVRFTPDGKIRPLAINYDKTRTYGIDRVLAVITRKNISERSTGDEVCGHMITLGTGVPGTAM